MNYQILTNIFIQLFTYIVLEFVADQKRREIYGADKSMFGDN